MYSKTITFKKNFPQTLYLTHLEFLENPKLSLTAKGILTFLLLQLPSWIFSIEDLQAKCSNSISEISKGLEELIEHGYVTKEGN